MYTLILWAALGNFLMQPVGAFPSMQACKEAAAEATETHESDNLVRPNYGFFCVKSKEGPSTPHQP